MKKFLAQDNLKTRYTGIVEPHCRYSRSDCGKCGKSKKNHLQKLKNPAVRIIAKGRLDADARSLLNPLGLKSIHDLINIDTSITIHKALNGLAPKHLTDLFVRILENHLRVLRNISTEIQVPKKTSKNGQKFLSFRGFQSWNALPVEIKHASFLQVFKTKTSSPFLSCKLDLYICIFLDYNIYFALFVIGIL